MKNRRTFNGTRTIGNGLLLATLFVFCQCNNEPDDKSIDKECEQDQCCSIESSEGVSETSEITCPECGHKEVETLPTEVCMIKYDCKNCGEVLTPKDGDCCVFCTHGTHKCPSKQEE